MVSSVITLSGAVVVILALIGKGTALKCYDCSNLTDKKCGVSFDFSGTEGDKYIVNCEGMTVACRKVETTDSHKAVKVVIRSCWNSTGVEDLDEDFLDCTKMASIGKACYCNKDLDGGKPCNDGQQVYAFPALVISALVAVLTLFA